MVRRLRAADLEPLAMIDAGERSDALLDCRRRQVLPELLDPGLIVPGIAPELEALLDNALAPSETATHEITQWRPYRRTPAFGRA